MSDEKTLPDFDKLWDYNLPAQTEATFRQILPRAEASGDRSYHAQLLTQIARAQGLQRRFDDAQATLDQVQRLLDCGDDIPIARTRLLLEQGRVLNSSGHPTEARPFFQRAFEIAVKEQLDFHAIDAAHMIAIVEPDATLQLEWNLRAMELAEKSADERARGWRGSLYNNIGWTYFEQKEYEKAMEVFEKAVELRAAAGKPRELRIARYCVAKTLRMQGKIDQAITIDRQLVQEAEQAGDPDGYLLEELAECLLAMGRNDEAKPYFRRAHEELSKDPWLAENEPKRLERMRQLGR